MKNYLTRIIIRDNMTCLIIRNSIITKIKCSFEMGK